MSYEIELLPSIQSRLRCTAEIYKRNFFNPSVINVIVDTGCPNTLIPLHRAKIFGVKTEIKQTITVGNFSGETTAYIIRRIQFGTVELRSVVMFAAEFKRELQDTILLGLNIMNNWNYTVKRNVNKIELDEVFDDDTRNSKYPYQRYFSGPEKLSFIQESIE